MFAPTEVSRHIRLARVLVEELRREPVQLGFRIRFPQAKRVLVRDSAGFFVVLDELDLVGEEFAVAVDVVVVWKPELSANVRKGMKDKNWLGVLLTRVDELLAICLPARNTAFLSRFSSAFRLPLLHGVLGFRKLAIMNRRVLEPVAVHNMNSSPILLTKRQFDYKTDQQHVRA